MFGVGHVTLGGEAKVKGVSSSQDALTQYHHMENGLNLRGTI